MQSKKYNSRPISAYNNSSRTNISSTIRIKKRPVSATTPAAINRLHSTQLRHSNHHHYQQQQQYSYNSSTSPPRNNNNNDNNNNNSYFQSHQYSSHLSYQPSQLSPTHREVYKRLIIDAVHTINCPILYRTLLKLEKAFQPDQRAKQRFAKMVYLSACQGDQDYDPLVNFLKSQMGVCISLAECRQLVLYSGLFGDTSSPNPSKENMKQVVTSMHLHVPQLFYYQKWCRDVKKLETKIQKPTTGYFSSKWKNNTNPNLISPDISSVITTNSDDHSKHSNQSLERIPSFNNKNDEENDDTNNNNNNHNNHNNRNSMYDQRATSSRHLAMLQAIANGEEDDDEFIPPPPKPKALNRFKKIALSLVAVGSDLSLLTDETTSKNLQQLTNHTPFSTNPPPKRKTGQSNVYMLSDTPEYRKLVANLARGDSTVSPTGEVLGQIPKEDGNEWGLYSQKESYDRDEMNNPPGSSTFLLNVSPLNSNNNNNGNGNNNKMEVNIFNMKGDPIKDGYYVNAASRVEVLNFLDPKYNSGSISVRNETDQEKSLPKLQKILSSDKLELVIPQSNEPEVNETTSAVSTGRNTSSPSTIAGSRRLSKSYSQVLLDEDETILRENPVVTEINPFSTPPIPKSRKNSAVKATPPITPILKNSPTYQKFKSPRNTAEPRKMSLLDDIDESYQMKPVATKSSSSSSSPSPLPLPTNTNTKINLSNLNNNNNNNNNNTGNNTGNNSPSLVSPHTIKSPKKGVSFTPSKVDHQAPTRFITSVTVGLAKLRLLKKLKQPNGDGQENTDNRGNEYDNPSTPPSKKYSTFSRDHFPLTDDTPSLTNLLTLYNPDNSFMLDPNVDHH